MDLKSAYHTHNRTKLPAGLPVWTAVMAAVGVGRPCEIKLKWNWKTEWSQIYPKHKVGCTGCPSTSACLNDSPAPRCCSLFPVVPLNNPALARMCGGNRGDWMRESEERAETGGFPYSKLRLVLDCVFILGLWHFGEWFSIKILMWETVMCPSWSWLYFESSIFLKILKSY